LAAKKTAGVKRRRYKFSSTTKLCELKFRAVLTQGGARQVNLPTAVCDDVSTTDAGTLAQLF
jgi:hypothetical protein